MRPIRLTMTAFGPYAGTEVVDFTAALEAGIFGIYGDTGAGKTTIFDGISFALFGKSSGAERAAEDMVSDYAHADDITRVELVFDLGDERYVVRRIPRQQRAAQRGGGQTSEPHQAYLFRATGISLDEITDEHPGEMLEERHVNKVDPRIEDLLGYDAVQFRQIVLLPQGDFRKILTASSDERSPILKRLFDVRMYETFVDRIKRQAADLHRQISNERVARTALLGDFTEEALSEAIALQNKEIAEIDGSLKTDEEELEKRVKALAAGESLAEKFTALEEARKEETGLGTEAETVDDLRKRLAKARAAQSVLPSEAILSAAREETRAADNRHREALKRLNSQRTAHADAKDALEITSKQSGERDAARTKVQELERFKKTLNQSTALLTELNGTISAATEAAEKETEAKAKHHDAEKILEGLRLLQQQQPEHERALREAIANVTELEKESDALGRYEAAVTKRDQQSHTVVELKGAHETQAAHLEECRSAFETAEQELSDIQALHVAHKLEHGVPCPACGSTDHPDPATGDPERRGRHDQFEAADRNLRQADRLVAQSQAALGEAQKTLSARQAELDAFDKPNRERAALLPVLTEAQALRTRLEADNRFAELDGKITKAVTSVAEASTLFENARKAHSDCQEAQTRAKTTNDTLLRDVPENWRDETALETSLVAAATTRDQLNSAHENAIADEQKAAVDIGAAEKEVSLAIGGVERASKAMTEAEDGFTAQLSKAELDDAALQSAKIDVEQSAALQDQINDYDQRKAANKAQLVRLAEEIGENKTPDTVALRVAKDTAQDKLDKKRETRTRLKSEVDAKLNTQGKVQALSLRIGELEIEYGPVGELSNLVNGTNDRKVRLPDFAIAAMFDEVLIAANLRLEPMTDGRFHLRRPSDVGGGQKKQGLDIAVFDSNTEKERSTTTLSGGQGFQASLALALGLSDVVQQNTGGIKLDAIFIDEGFGSLDEDTLSTALETLYSLTNDMRAVGLISHTEQVKSMISAGFDIEATPSGSHIHPRLAAA